MSKYFIHAIEAFLNVQPFEFIFPININGA